MVPRPGSRNIVWFALLAVLLCAPACGGGGSNGHGDAGVDGDTDDGRDAGGDADGDTNLGLDSDIDADGDSPRPEDVPDCGDGVVDEGEECDDGNRLNGDSCDWVCRLGGGTAPPEPDPTVPDYVPSGEPVPATDVTFPVLHLKRLPLTWSGTEFATAYHSPSPIDATIHFHRFDADGRSLDSDWEYPAVHFTDVSFELVWTGTEYGLFYLDGTTGVFFLGLDVAGKPLGEPVLVVAEPDALDPAADVAPEGYVVIWRHCDHPECWVSSLLIGPDGSTEGLPEPLVLADSIDSGSRRADVATGPGGYGVTMAGDEDTVRFVWVSEDLAEVTTSGILGGGRPGDVLWAGDGYVTAWDWRDSDRTYLGTCVARFSSAGVLEAPPVCNRLLETSDDISGTRLIAGDGGLALVFHADSNDRLLFVRTDAAGVPVAPPHDVLTSDSSSRVYGVGTTWADDSFAILYGASPSPLMLQRFVRASP